MNGLLKITVNENQEQMVSGRMLHGFLEVKTAYKDWFKRMCEYGFTEGVDFNPLKNEQVRNEGGREVKREILDHIIKLDMAKELCMLARSDRGKEARQYFISVERDWNSPEKVMARALLLAQSKIELLEPKAKYYDLILNNKELLPITMIAKDYGMTAQELNTYLRRLGIQYKRGKVWYLYAKYDDCGYTKARTYQSEEISATTTYWTQKGRLFIYNLLKKHGVLPLIEVA